MDPFWKLVCICSLVAAAVIAEKVESQQSFVIDYSNNQFLKDGKPFRYISGCMHFFRVPKIYWADRLAKMAAAGLNAVQTYVDWSQHEPYPGVYNFDDNLDLVSFLKLAQKMGFLVILRPGPYIDAERDMGGFPFWLLQINPKMPLRTNDPTYLKYVDKWFNKLLPMVKPYLYANGGPVISVQVENEYGSYPACDFTYMAHLRDLFRSILGNNVILFTTDGGNDSYLKCGKTQGVYSTVDFGPGTDVKAAFHAQRNHEPQGPFVNSEYYPGWLDHWSYPHAAPDLNSTLKTLDEMLAMNASVNMYMFHGGTNFAFTNGANLDSTFDIIPTSYDYNAPLSEAGDPTEKYTAIKKVISKYSDVPPPPVPPPVPKYNYGSIPMKPIGSLFNMLSVLQSHTPIPSVDPLTFEQLGQAYGFVLYETVVNQMVMDPAVLSISGIRDRAIVLVDEIPYGILSRQDSITSLPITILKGQKLSIFVENQGRVCYGSGILDTKGIVSSVTLSGNVLKNWNITPVPLNNTKQIDDAVQSLLNMDMVAKKMPLLAGGRFYAPGVFAGQFTAPNNTKFPLDTFLQMDGWYKGVALINGHNIGRYWPVVGPQVTLYVPKSVLKPYPSPNTIVMIELEHAPCYSDSKTLPANARDGQCAVELVDKPIIDAPTPHDNQKSKWMLYRHFSVN